jgi:hypothetical protein
MARTGKKLGFAAILARKAEAVEVEATTEQS